MSRVAARAILVRTVLSFVIVLIFRPYDARAQTAPASRPVGGNLAALTVAVLDFDADVAANPNFGKQIAETLTATLSGEPGFVLVDRVTLAKTLQEHELNLTGLVKPEEAVKIGHLVGAKVLITGKAFSLDKSVFLTAKLIGVETSLVNGIVVKGKPETDLGDLVGQLADKVAARLRETGATLVAAPNTAADPLPELRKKLAGRKLPKLAIVASDQHIGPPWVVRAIDPPIDNELRTLLTSCGFTVVGADVKDLAKAGVKTVIRAEGFSEFGVRIGNLVSCSARVELTAVRMSDDKTLVSDAASSRAADLSENIAGKTALQQATHEVGIRLLSHLADTLPSVDAAAVTQPSR